MEYSLDSSMKTSVNRRFRKKSTVNMSVKNELQKLSIYSKKEKMTFDDKEKTHDVYKRFIEQLDFDEGKEKKDNRRNIFIIENFNNAKNIIFDNSTTKVENKEGKAIRNIKVNLRSDNQINKKAEKEQKVFQKKRKSKREGKVSEKKNKFIKEINVNLGRSSISNRTTPIHLGFKEFSKGFLSKTTSKIDFSQTFEHSYINKEDSVLEKLKKKKTKTKNTKLNKLNKGKLSSTKLQINKRKINQSIPKLPKRMISSKKFHLNRDRGISNKKSMKTKFYKTVSEIRLPNFGLKKNSLWNQKKKNTKLTREKSTLYTSNSSLQQMTDKGRLSHNKFVRKLFRTKTNIN